MQKKQLIAIIFFLTLIIAATGHGGEILIDDFAAGLRPGWQEKIFKGKTEYRLVQDSGQSVLMATSDKSASGLYYEIAYDPNKYPVLSWSWKIDHVLNKGNAYQKSGDDYAARIYVVFHSLFFWNTKTLNYIWANKLPKGEAIPNPYTANVVMIAVQSGNDLAGEWRAERRNIREDYIRYFGGQPGPVDAIAIMTDTDNTQEQATAYYGPIRVLSVDQAQQETDRE
ncbi:MAG: hypothetical protein A2521_15570 [Deltaproteobacteria bacterium RIFOXYD12_FULL_57_12]|nr:MAG: hypothetical protein A2521_15570 [Deltaproteobacteria bacterium RIFOXYD12_FULL_57_12]